MKTKPFITFLLALSLFGCTTAGVKNIEYAEFDRTTIIDRDYDEVWGLVLEWSAINGFPIEKTDKNDGIIMLTGSGTVNRSFLLHGEAELDQRLVSCGEATGNIGLYQGKFTDLVINATIILRRSNESTRVTVNMSGNVGVEVRNSYGVVSSARNTCASRGVFEQKLFSDLKEI